MARFPWTALAFGGSVVASIGAVVVASRRSSQAPRKQRIALIGDSYAVGLGPELKKLLPDFKYEGIVGTNTAQWANRAVDWISMFKPDVALVSLGVNDGSSPNLANYQAIVRELHGTGARVVWIEPPAAVNAPAVRAAIASLGVQTVSATQAALATDGLHPRSYVPWARDVAKAVTRA